MPATASCGSIGSVAGPASCRSQSDTGRRPTRLELIAASGQQRYHDQFKRATDARVHLRQRRRERGVALGRLERRICSLSAVLRP